MKILDTEKIAARKFVEIKGMEYLDSNKYTMSKNVTEEKESNEIKFEFFIAKARPKQDLSKTVKSLLMKIFRGMRLF